ncbi:MAG TPA: TPM domain-containing protein [Steroidobacteraceae bacterium]|nr:TPM domain-containing protein [Steroidobacteraceae bacterium]
MKLGRVLRHLFATRWNTRRRFPPQTLALIETAIREAERLHAGEIRFAVETALDLPEVCADLPPRTRALQIFGQLGVWDTAANNGVLIYLLLADRVVEIVADRGIAVHIDPVEWSAICQEMERCYGDDKFSEGTVAGVLAVGRLLGRHFPGRGDDPDELPNQPVLL